MDPKREVHKQTEAIGSESLLPQEYKLEYIKKVHNSESVLHSDKHTLLHNTKHIHLYIAHTSHVACNGKQ